MSHALQAERGYFETLAPTTVILASFFIFTLPLVALSLLAPDFLAKAHLASIYFVVIGGTHFCITVALYLQSENLAHFNTSSRTRLIYFGIPAAIFLTFMAYRGFGIATSYPNFDFYFVSLIRFFNFYHWGRQSFGVLQLFKRRSGYQFHPWQRHAENLFFYVVLIPMMFTYLNDGVWNALSAWMATPALILFAFITAGFARMPQVGNRKSVKFAVLFLPILYLLLQTTSAVFTIYSTAFYVFALAMHYVEYHVLMYPRVFKSTLGESKLNSVFGLLRENKFVFYFALLNFAAIASTLIATSGVSRGTKSSFVLAIFDGLFVFHYFVESFVWRFSEPYYRQTLLPLFFSPWSTPASKNSVESYG